MLLHDEALRLEDQLVLERLAVRVGGRSSEDEPLARHRVVESPFRLSHLAEREARADCESDSGEDQERRQRPQHRKPINNTDRTWSTARQPKEPQQAPIAKAGRFREGNAARRPGPTRRRARRTCGAELVGVGVVDDEAARLAAPVRARLPEPGRGGDRDAGLPSLQPRTRAARRSRPGGCGRRGSARRRLEQCGEHVVAAGDRLLPRAPRRADHLVVHRRDAKRARRGPRRTLGGPRSCASRRPPDWCRQGRTELSPTTKSPSAR